MDIEKLKRKRGRKSKKELEFIKKYELENNVKLNDKDNKKPKKRGRKPKGGKIVSQTDILNYNNEVNHQNIIVHLRCSEDDLNNIDLISDIRYNPNIESLKLYKPYTNELQEDTGTLSCYNIEVDVQNVLENDEINDKETIIQQNNNSNNECKLLWEKLKTLQTKLHTNNVSNKQSSCFWCTYEFNNPAISIPLHEVHGNYKGYGCFCSPECAVGYLFDEHIDISKKWERYSLMNTLYKDVYSYKDNINPAPKPHYLLDKFYGDLTIDEYRKLNMNSNTSGILMVVNKPMTRIMPELFQDVNNKVIENKSKYKLSRKKPPINKTVVDDKTWLF